MPVHPTYPGVYVEEIDSGLKPVSEVATSVAAFVGSFQRGLVNEAVQLLGMSDFEREYGGLDRLSETSYAIQQFFMNGGSEAWVVRVVNAAIAARIEMKSFRDDSVFIAVAGRRIRGNRADNAGAWGNNLRVEVDYDTAIPAEQFNLTIMEVQSDGDYFAVVQSEVFRNLTMRPNAPNNALEVVNQGSRLVQLLPGVAPPIPFVTSFRPASSGTFSGVLATGPIVIPPGPNVALDLTITGTVAAIPATIAYAPAAVPTSYAELLPFMQNMIRQSAFLAGTPVALRPLLTGAVVQLVADGADQRYVVKLGKAARGYASNMTLTISGGQSITIKLVAGAAATDGKVRPQQLQAVAAGGSMLGTDGVAPAAGATFRPITLNNYLGSAALHSGINALDFVDLFNILCMPEVVHLTAADMRSVYSAAENYVTDRRAMLLVDIPENITRLDVMQQWMVDNAQLRHPNAAVYFPRTNLVDPLNDGRVRSVAASGTIAGLWARTDVARGVWKAPAGTEARLRNIESLTYVMTDLENGTLNPIGVNCLRNFPIYSNICWGARTLNGADVMASDWKYVPVRRTTLFLEESLYRGTKWVVFEPNDEPLWSQIRLNVGSFMHDLFRKGAFQGKTPREAYYVRCDSGTTPQSDIDKGVVNIEVGFAPLKPAEFVVLKIQQIARISAE